VEDGGVVISLAVPMRLLPPRSFHAPARAPLSGETVAATTDTVAKTLFSRLKKKTR
jgi:hypothetical protein